IRRMSVFPFCVLSLSLALSVLPTGEGPHVLVPLGAECLSSCMLLVPLEVPPCTIQSNISLSQSQPPPALPLSTELQPRLWAVERENGECKCRCQYNCTVTAMCADRRRSARHTVHLPR